MNVYLKGIAATGPGFANWEALRSHFAAGAELDPGYTPRPAGTILPAGERRRASATIKLAVDVAQDAVRQSGMQAEDLAVVFASSNGDTDTLHRICEALATPERFVSPTNFHNSVHNAPAGYWSIASGSMMPSSTLCAWNDTFAAALIEAASQCLAEDTPVLLTVYDTPFPQPLAGKAPGSQPFGIALVLDTRAENSLAVLSLAIDGDTQTALTKMREAKLEALRCDSSAAHALPFLAALAAPTAEDVVLGYAGDMRLRVRINPQDA